MPNRVADAAFLCHVCGRINASCTCPAGPTPVAESDHDPGGFNTAGWTRKLRSRVSVRLDPISRAFWVYEDGVWRESREVVADVLPLMMGRYQKSYAANVSDRLRAELLSEKCFVTPDRPDPRYVSLPSGLYEIATGKVVEHDPGVMALYQLTADPVFDAPTPEFDRFLESVLVPGDRERVLDILAYLIGPGNPQQRAVMLHGTGRNGKGVLLSLLTEAFGNHQISTVALNQMSSRFSASRLYGKPLNLVGDIDAGHIKDTGVFKQITGGDPVEMDVKHHQAFTATVWAVPVFSANRLPSFSDSSHGNYRRWVVVDFPNQFDGSDVTLKDRLAAELPAILGKLLQRLTENGMVIRDSEPGNKALDRFMRRSDPVREWLSENEAEGFHTTAEAFARYKAWCEEQNRKAPNLPAFRDRMRELLGKEVRRRHGRGWVLEPGQGGSQVSPTVTQVSPRLSPPHEPVTSENSSQVTKVTVSQNFYTRDVQTEASERSEEVEGLVRGTGDVQPPSEARGQAPGRAEVGEAWDIFLDEVPGREPMSVLPDPFAD